MKSIKPSWDEYFFRIAVEVSTRASCPRKKHGCVIVDKTSHRILSTGYNGAPSGYSSCDEVGCYLIDNHCKRAEHAERNAIYSAASHGISLNGSIAYVTGQPCVDCTRALISVGVSAIYYLKDGHYSYPEIEQNLIDEMRSTFKTIQDKKRE